VGRELCSLTGTKRPHREAVALPVPPALPEWPPRSIWVEPAGVLSPLAYSVLYAVKRISLPEVIGGVGGGAGVTTGGVDVGELEPEPWVWLCPVWWLCEPDQPPWPVFRPHALAKDGDTASQMAQRKSTRAVSLITVRANDLAVICH
jgi:hypothetical protein